MSYNSTLQGGIMRLWWIPLFTGLLSIALGIWCLCSPVASMKVFAYVFAACLCAGGIVNLIFAGVNSRIGWNWGWALALGLIEAICGIWLLTLPSATVTSVFIFVMAIWIIIAAINALCESFVMASYSAVWVGWSVILLIATIVLAFVFMFNPISGGIAVWMWIGLSLIFFGVYRLVFAANIRQLNKLM